jgi:hypothetical protein
MTWVFNNILSNLIVIVLVALANNVCFVAVAKINKWRLARRDKINELYLIIDDLEKKNAILHEIIAEYEVCATETEDLVLRTSGIVSPNEHQPNLLNQQKHSL